jgi:ketosteroid isomerase-like protein
MFLTVTVLGHLFTPNESLNRRRIVVKEQKMRLGLRVLSIAALLAVTVAFGVAHKHAEIAQASEETAVREALMKSAMSFEKNDLPMASQVWVNDESLTIFESGHANYGWADYRDNHLVPEMGEMKNTRYAFSDMKIHLAGNTAWATLKYTIAADVMEKGKPRHVDGAGLGTAVLEKRGEQWRIVHWHSSAPRRAPTTPAPPKN